MNAPAPQLSKSGIAGRDGFWIGMALLLAAVALVGVCIAPQRINQDCALYLQQASLFFEGAVPYRDFIADASPPLIVYLNVVPVALARMIGLSPIPVFSILAIVLVLVTGLEIHFVLRKWRSGMAPASRGLVLLVWMAAYFVVDWRNDVGQREHLFILLYMPYLFLRMLRYRGGAFSTRLAVAVGVQAGLGTALRPYFLLLAVNVEIVMLLASFRQKMLLQPENLALVAVVTTNLLHWLVVPAVMSQAFFGRWLPLTSHGYGAYSAGYRDVAETILNSPISLAGLAAAVTAGLLCVKTRARLRHHLVALTVLANMALVLVFLHQGAQSYHRTPLEIAGALCLTVLIVEGNQQRTIGPRRTTIGVWPLAGGAVAFAILLAVWFVERKNHGFDAPDEAALREVVLQHSQPSDRVLIVSSSVSPAYPMLLQTGRRPGSRYLYSFPAAFLYAGTKAPSGSMYRNREAAPLEETQFLDEMRDDVVRHHPQLIIVQNSAHGLGLPEGFNLFDYLSYTGWTDEALGPYHELRGPEGWKVFGRKQ
jgi:hypothetical protein